MTDQKHTKEAEDLADAILTAAGSGLRYYSMHKTRTDIFTSAQNALDSFCQKRFDLLTEVTKQRDELKEALAIARSLLKHHDDTEPQEIEYWLRKFEDLLKPPTNERKE